MAACGCCMRRVRPTRRRIPLSEVEREWDNTRNGNNTGDYSREVEEGGIHSWTREGNSLNDVAIQKFPLMIGEWSKQDDVDCRSVTITMKRCALEKRRRCSNKWRRSIPFKERGRSLLLCMTHSWERVELNCCCDDRKRRTSYVLSTTEQQSLSSRRSPLRHLLSTEED